MLVASNNSFPENKHNIETNVENVLRHKFQLNAQQVVEVMRKLQPLRCHPNYENLMTEFVEKSEQLQPALQDRVWDPKLDAVTASPCAHKVLFESGLVRILKVKLKPQTKETFHTHQWASI